MSNGVISAVAAWRIVRRFAADVAEHGQESVLAVIVIGSLAAGHYRPGRSDIDTVVVLQNNVPQEVVETVRGLQKHYQEAYNIPKGLGAVVMRERVLFPPYDPAQELVPEILRLKRQGIAIWGSYDLETIPEPSATDFHAYARVFYPWLHANYVDRRPEEARTVDATVNTILYELRLLIWNATGEYVLDKPDVIPKALALNVIQTLHTQLNAIQHYLVAGDGPESVQACESALEQVADIVRSQVMDAG